MKKLFITIAFVAAAMFASAQLYVGGSLGMATQSGKYKFESGSTTVETDMPKTFSFTFAPEAGFMFADNMGVGLKLGFGMGKRTSKDGTDPVITTTRKTTEIGFMPYFRYVFAEVDNFKFYADAQVAYAMSKPKITVEGGETTTTTDGNKTTAIGFGIVPGMAYMLTDNISMNCTLNVLALSFEQTKAKLDDWSSTETAIGFGINRATPVTIGFFYNF